ncbi:MAG: LptF/LptG family permease [Bacteroidetes bacterium]|nr:LptF/LptG family permease [Bacteroidota bacterium]
MKRLHLFIIKSFIGPFILNLVITNFLFLMIWIWKYVDDLIGKGLELSVLMELIGYWSLWQIPMCLPLSILLSSIMTFGKLAESSELTAIKSLGISLQRAMFSLIVFNGLIAVGAFYFSNHVLPYTALRMQTMINDITQKKPELNIPEGVFYNGMDNYTIRIEKKYSDKTMRGVMLFDHRKEDNSSFIIADSGKIETISDKRGKFMKLSLYKGHAFKEDQNTNNSPLSKARPFLRSSFGEHIIYIDMSAYALQQSDGSMFKGSSQMINLRQLGIVIDSLKQDVLDRRVNLAKELNEYYYFPKDSLINVDTVHPYAMSKDVFSMIAKDSREKVIQEAQQSVRSAQGYPNRSATFEEERTLNRYRYEVEWHKKYTLSFACLILFFIGAPFGAIVRKGGLGWPVVFAILLFLIYYVLAIIGEKLGKKGSMDVGFGMWLSSIVLTPIGIFLSYKATRDSKLFSRPAFFNKIANVLKRKE